MAAPVIESGDCIQTFSGTTTSHSLTFPAYNAGDLVLVHFTSDSNATHTLPASGPNGETIVTIASGYAFSSAERVSVFYWIGNATVSSSTTTITTSGNIAGIGITAIVPDGEFDSTTPIDSYNTTGSSDSSDVPSPAWTCTNAGGRVVVYSGVDVDPVTAAPSGWTIISNQDGGPIVNCLSTRDTATSASESIASANWTIASDTSSSVGYVINGPASSAFTAVVAATLPSITASASATFTAASTLPVDILGTTYFSFSLKKLRDDYSGNCLKVRESAGDTTLDIGFDGNGDLDVSALETFLAGADGYIETFYDQSEYEGIFTNATTSTQWQIASGGTVLTDVDGNVGYRMTSQLQYTLPTTVQTDDTCMFFAGNRIQVKGDSTERCVLGLKTSASSVWTNKYQFATSADVNYSFAGVRVRLGNGTQSVSLPSSIRAADANFPNLLCVQTFPTGSDSRVEIFRNNLLLATNTAFAYGGATAATAVLGDPTADYFCQAITLSASVTDETRQSAHDAFQDLFGLGMKYSATVNEGALFAQDYEFQVELYDWMETITTTDVDTDSQIDDFTWDATSADGDELYDIWRKVYSERSDWAQTSEFHLMARMDKKWFVLDDGASAGIEGSGSIRAVKKTSGYASLMIGGLMHLYDINLPKTASGQGNPYYQSSEVAHRGLMYAAMQLLMIFDKADTDQPGWGLSYQLGGSVADCACAFVKWGSLISSGGQAAFKAAFAAIARRLHDVGPYDYGLGNMTAKALPTLAATWVMHDGDSITQTICEEAIRQLLFGAYDNDFSDVQADYDRAIESLMTPNGTLMENYGGTDNFYLGDSINEVARAASLLQGESLGTELIALLNAMQEFRILGWLVDENGTYSGASGYCTRTGSDTRSSGATDGSRDAYCVAVGGDVTHPLVPSFTAEATMETNISVTGLNVWNGSDIGLADTSTPPVYSPQWQEAWWPIRPPYDFPSDFYSTHKIIVDASSTTLNPPWENTAAFNRTLGRDFWMLKSNDGSRDYGWIVETFANPGTGNGWWNGSVQAFWAEDIGPIICARHDKAGSDYEGDDENTRAWGEIERWATEGIWGTSAGGTYKFHTAATGSLSPRTVDYTDMEATTPTVVYTQTYGGNSAAGSEGMQHVEALPNHACVMTKTFTHEGDGLRCVVDVTKTAGSDQVNQLWYSIPIMLHRSSTGAPANDASVEYWTGSAWAALAASTETLSTSKLRIVKDLGSGDRYAYILFPSDYEIRLNPNIYQQVYQGTSRHQNINISLLPTQEVDTTWPSSIDFEYTLSSTEVASTSVNVAVELPALQCSIVASHTVPGWTADIDAQLPALEASVGAVKYAANEWVATISADLPALEASAVAARVSSSGGGTADERRKRKRRRQL